MRKSIFIVFILLGCNNRPNEETSRIFIAADLSIRHNETKNSTSYEDGDITSPPPPPCVYYANNNIIIDNSGNLFYYTLNKPTYYCGTGHENENIIPEYITLEPSKIIEVPDNTANFIAQNFKIINGKCVLIFSSTRDTFQSPKLAKLYQILDNDTKTEYVYILRKTTAQEDTVLHYKFTGKVYDPYKVKWDSSTINLNSSLIKNQ